MDDNSKYIRGDLTDLAESLSSQTAKMEKTDERMRENVKKSINDFRITIVVIVLSIILYFAGNIFIRMRNYDYMEDWQKTVSQTKIVGRGRFNFGITQVVITSQFPQFANLMYLLAAWKDLNQQGALFLMMCVQHIHTNMKRELNSIHWAGSPDQLGGEQGMKSFLGCNDFEPTTSINDKRAAMFSAWERSAGTNVWYNIFPKTQSDFFSITMFDEFVRGSGCYANQTSSILHSLYTGGLCKVAHVHFTDGTSALEVFHRIFGVTGGIPPACKLQTVEGALNGIAGLGAIAPGLPGVQAAVAAHPLLAVGGILGVAAVGAYVNAKAAEERCHNVQ